jgi:hypothetical protein
LNLKIFIPGDAFDDSSEGGNGRPRALGGLGGGCANRLVERPRLDCLFLGTALLSRCTGWLTRKPSVLLGLLAGRPIRVVA